MADRSLVWFFPDLAPPVSPSYFAEEDLEKVAVRIHADTVPHSGDCKIDIMADGVSIFIDHTFDYIGYKRVGVNIVPDTTVALPETQNSEEYAEMFTPDDISAGAWITCKLTAPSGARNITVILELNRVTESDEPSTI